MCKTREQFIDENKTLFWYIKKDKLLQISDEKIKNFLIAIATQPF